jgi:hypothetical protein
MPNISAHPFQLELITTEEEHEASSTENPEATVNEKEKEGRLLLSIAAEPVMRLALNEATRRHALGDTGLLAHYTRLFLEENDLSLYDQEHWTSVSAADVRAMDQGRPIELGAVRRFAATAKRLSQSAESRLYWERIFVRLAQCPDLTDYDAASPSLSVSAGIAEDEFTLRFAELTSPRSREAVVRLIAALRSIEIAAVPHSVSDDEAVLSRPCTSNAA